MTPETQQAQRAQRLLLGVLGWAIRDDDVEWIVASPVFGLYCRLLGLNDDSIFEFQQRYLRGQLAADVFDERRLEAFRHGPTQPADPVFWDAWPGAAPLTGASI